MKHCTKDLMLAMAAMSAIGGALASCDKKEEGKYNIVFIMTDDHTAQMMSCYDRRYIQTPNHDRIAEDGVRFTNSFVANSLCGPSRACLLTGKHSHANGYTDNKKGSMFDGSQQTFPKLLQEAGYQTALVGKWHLGSDPTGFDYWEVIPGQGHYYNPDFITSEGTKRHEGYYGYNHGQESGLA
jgi:arylsulfatase A-like enzyme